MNIAYAVDDSRTSIIDLTSSQGFKETQGCDETDGDAVWCV